MWLRRKEANNMKAIIKNTLILFAITLVAGLGLGFVYNVTSEARKSQEEKTMLAAYESVMPGMERFDYIKTDFSNADTPAYRFIQDKIKENESKNNISVIKPFNATIDSVANAYDKEGNSIGYIVTVTDNEAYDGSLQMTVGIKEDGTVIGISFLSLSETPGLGMKADAEDFKSQFQKKKVDFFQYEKSGVSSDNEINAISSATITSNAVVHGVNAAIYCVEYIIGGGR